MATPFIDVCGWVVVAYLMAQLYECLEKAGMKAVE